ncbi:hypothetical protein [Streptomyces sp. NPDC059224]|uniref:hypothetical protein n=1 Tax=Streptomyces sp. NPDC059224 TaxID=3346775 RepID=UPI0036A9FF25
MPTPSLRRASGSLHGLSAVVTGGSRGLGLLIADELPRRDERREFAWFSALAGTPLISMDARRAAGRIVTAVQHRVLRLVLTPAPRVADKAHGLAPALTTRLSHAATALLPTAADEPGPRRVSTSNRPPRARPGNACAPRAAR